MSYWLLRPIRWLWRPKLDSQGRLHFRVPSARWRDAVGDAAEESDGTNEWRPTQRCCLLGEGSRGDVEGRGARCPCAPRRGRARHGGIERSRCTLPDRKGQPFMATCGGAIRQPGDRALDFERRETGELRCGCIHPAHPLLAEVHERLATEHLRRLDHA